MAHPGHNRSRMTFGRPARTAPVIIPGRPGSVYQAAMALAGMVREWFRPFTRMIWNCGQEPGCCRGDSLQTRRREMTEAEWRTSLNSQKMIAALSGKGSERLWRLFAVACARRIEHLMRDDASRKALEVATRFADGTATREQLTSARLQAEAAFHQAGYELWIDEPRANFCWDAGQKALAEAKLAAEAALQCVAEDIGNKPDGQVTVIAACLQLPDLIREIFGNPFRWTVVDPDWLLRNDRAVFKIAQGIYRDRAFDRLPILADALEDAGCDDHDVLAHCRQPGEHVPGCWAVDSLLGYQ